MNSTKLEGAQGYKKPLSKSNFHEPFQRFKEAMSYLKSIKIEGENKSIFFTLSSTPFVGF